MSSPSTGRRLAVPLLAGGLLLPLAACSFSANGISCSTSSCSVTLTGEGAEADIFGTTLALGNVEDGRASLRVGDARVSCGEGETVSAGQLRLECATVTDDSVELRASLG